MAGWSRYGKTTAAWITCLIHLPHRQVADDTVGLILQMRAHITLDFGAAGSSACPNPAGSVPRYALPWSTTCFASDRVHQVPVTLGPSRSFLVSNCSGHGAPPLASGRRAWQPGQDALLVHLGHDLHPKPPRIPCFCPGEVASNAPPRRSHVRKLATWHLNLQHL